VSRAASHRDHAHPVQGHWRASQARDEARTEGSKEGEAQKVIITQSGPNAFFVMSNAIPSSSSMPHSRRTRK